MAYKFQLGAARLGGAITSTGTVSGSVVDSQGALSGAAIQVDDAGGIAGNGLQNSGGALTIKLDGSTGITVDGDGMSLAGIPNSSLANSSISGKSLGANLDNLVDGNGIADFTYNGGSTATISVQISGSGTGLSATEDGLKLASIPNATLANSAVTLTQGAGMAAMGAVSLGGNVTVAVDGVLEDLDTLGAAGSDGQFIVATGAGAFAYESGATVRNSLGLGTGDAVEFGNITGVTGSFAGNLTVNGDLTILGSTVSASVEQLRIQDALITVGDGDTGLATGRGFEIGNNLASFKVASGSEMGFNFSSSLPVQAGTLSSDTAFIGPQWVIGSTNLSGNLPITASGFSGDGSNLTGVSATGIQLTHGLIDSTSNPTASISTRVTIADSNNAAMLLNLPSIAPTNKGTMYIIKRKGSNNVTISSADANQVVEFANQDIVLETDGAAVTLIASENGAQGSWIIV